MILLPHFLENWHYRPIPPILVHLEVHLGTRPIVFPSPFCSPPLPSPFSLFSSLLHSFSPPFPHYLGLFSIAVWQLSYLILMPSLPPPHLPPSSYIITNISMFVSEMALHCITQAGFELQMLPPRPLEGRFHRHEPSHSGHFAFLIPLLCLFLRRPGLLETSASPRKRGWLTVGPL